MSEGTSLTKLMLNTLEQVDEELYHLRPSSEIKGFQVFSAGCRFIETLASRWFACHVLLLISTMSSKVKAMYKTLKHISQIFVVKERELEIGYPTDVKHVGHVGWDSPPDNARFWMNEFSSAEDHFAAHSLGDISDARDSSSTAVTAFSTWSSQDFDQALVGYQPTSDLFRDFPQTEPPVPPRNSKRKNSRATSSQSSARSSQAAKSISTFKGSRNL